MSAAASVPAASRVRPRELQPGVAVRVQLEPPFGVAYEPGPVVPGVVIGVPWTERFDGIVSREPFCQTLVRVKIGGEKRTVALARVHLVPAPQPKKRKRAKETP